VQDDDTLESGDPKRATVAAPGARIGKYEILRTLGAGGMGVVWAARDPDLDREVAIKLLRAEHASPDLRTRLLREARAMARLKHPNVLTVYEVASDSGRDFIVMELVDGHSLDAWLRESPSQRDVWDALFAAGRGLAAAHAAGLIHRDFKPHNVLRSRDGRVLVTDFGLARGSLELAETVEPSAADSILDVQLTATGQLLGTPAYMAPEQFDGETDARTDQFGFCVTAWEALSGTRPYEGTTIEQLRAAARSGAPRRDAKLPPGVRSVLARGLAPDPASRWEDMPALLTALQRTRRRWPRRLAVIAPLVVIAGVAGAFALRGHGVKRAPCDAMQSFGSAWTPELRAGVLAKHPELASLAPRIDDYRARWLRDYAQTCRDTTAAGDAVRACYREEREELALHVDLLQRYANRFVGDRDLLDLLGARDSCTDHPASRRPLPDDAHRDVVYAFLAKVYGQLDETGGMVANFDGLTKEAAAINWPPLLGRTYEMIATAAAGFANVAVAQPAYRRAALVAHAAGDHYTEARARIGILQLAADGFEADLLPRSSYEDELRDAEVAVHDAGDDLRLLAVLDHVRAEHAAYADGDLSKAIELELKAMLPLIATGDVFDLTGVASAYASFLCVRAQPGDPERATKILDEDVVPAIRKSVAPGEVGYLRDARYWAAWLRGDVAGAHAALEPLPPFRLPPGTPIHGRVVDGQGHPVAGAHVVIWSGEMYGDRERAYTDVTQGHLATSAADGSFDSQATAGCGIIAELGAQRSVPLVAKDGVQLVLGPTRSITGTVDAGGEPNTGIEPYARIDVGPGIIWNDSIAPAADGTFTIAGIPAAATHVQLAALGSHWPRDRFRHVDAVGTTIRWPVGDTVDVIVPDTVAGVWLMRGSVAPKTLGELMKVSAAPDALHTTAGTIGWANATPGALVRYRAGAHHAVFHDIPAGVVTACIVQGPKVRCTSATADGHQAKILDERHWPGGTVVMF